MSTVDTNREGGIVLLQTRIRFSTECKHCGMKTNGFWLWQYEVRDKYLCGNCQFYEVFLTGVLDKVEIDPLKPVNKNNPKT